MKPRRFGIVRWSLHRGCGKANTELSRITNSTVEVPNAHSVFIIARAEVEALDFSRLRHEFSLDQPRRRLRGLLDGRVTFAVADYDGCEEELFEIPEIRQYFSELNLHFPCFLAFAATETESLRVIMAATAGQLQSFNRADQTHFEIHIPTEEIIRLFLNAFPLTNAILRNAGLSARKIRKFHEATAEHLGLE